ncbi:MAG: DUF3891 family protein [Verrucomicrobia bacterium]|nr:DUF3891 family protein [Verrucomicrobiota bacterium]
MLRFESGNGWWLVTHPDHARLAGHFAEHWGNQVFISPEPRADVLEGIKTHDDGWANRDLEPDITKQGKPSAFSRELVGTYSAFEEIDLLDYLAVRRQAVDTVVRRNPYAGLLVSMHTFDLLANRADRSTIRADQHPLLDAFLENQKALQQKVRSQLNADSGYQPADVSTERIENHFRLLQACDNLSLLSCVDYRGSASLLHALPITGGAREPVTVEHIGIRHFRLTPYPFDASPLTFDFPARFVSSALFRSKEDLREKFNAAEIRKLAVTVEGV